MGKRKRQLGPKKKVVPYRNSLELELNSLAQKLRNKGLTVEARAKLQRELETVVESLKIQEAGRDAIRRIRKEETLQIEETHEKSGFKSMTAHFVNGGLPSLGKKR